MSKYNKKKKLNCFGIQRMKNKKKNNNIFINTNSFNN